MEKGITACISYTKGLRDLPAGCCSYSLVWVSQAPVPGAAHRNAGETAAYRCIKATHPVVYVPLNVLYTLILPKAAETPLTVGASQTYGSAR
jgi:hypothetical protein